MERVRRIELPYAAWEAAVLPLNYTRAVGIGYSELTRILEEIRGPVKVNYLAWIDAAVGR